MNNSRRKINSWIAPVVATVILPAHATTSVIEIPLPEDDDMLKQQIEQLKIENEKLKESIARRIEEEKIKDNQLRFLDTRVEQLEKDLALCSK